MNIFFTSDNHFYHTNIIKYCNRPFKTVEEMNLTMIHKWNERVKVGDLVFHLGDFCLKHAPSESPDAPKDAFEIIRPQLNGDIILLNGNHDSRNGVKSIIESLIIDYGGKRIFLTHDPHYAKEDFYWNFTGHCHGNEGTFRKLGKKSYIIDLSVDCWNFYPANINDINQAFCNWLKSGMKNE